MNSLTETQNALLALISSALFDSQIHIDNYNWTEIKEEALSQTVFTLIFPIVKDILPDEIKREWVLLNARLVAKNLKVDFGHAEIHKIMTENNIPYTIMKGFSAAYYYPNPIYRMMGDVDFLVNKCDVDRAGAALESIGFSKEKGHQEQYHTEYCREKLSVELHNSMNGIPDGECGKRIIEYLSHFIEGSIVVKHEKIECRIPNELDHAIIMLIHMGNHITNGSGVGLRHLCDWAVYSNTVDISKYKHQLQEIGLWTFACILTDACTKYLGTKQYVWADSVSEVTVDRLVSDIFSSGNFGRKEANRATNIHIVNNDNYLASLADRSKVYFEFCAKHKFLLPLGMLAYSFRFLWLRITGKREWITSDMLKQAKERKKIYDQFMLFKI